MLFGYTFLLTLSHASFAHIEVNRISGEPLNIFIRPDASALDLVIAISSALHHLPNEIELAVGSEPFRESMADAVISGRERLTALINAHEVHFNMFLQSSVLFFDHGHITPSYSANRSTKMLTIGSNLRSFDLDIRNLNFPFKLKIHYENEFYSANLQIGLLRGRKCVPFIGQRIANPFVAGLVLNGDVLSVNPNKRIIEHSYQNLVHTFMNDKIECFSLDPDQTGGFHIEWME